MPRKFILPWLVVLFSVFMVSPALAGKTYRAENFDVLLDIQMDGSAIITEMVDFRFDGGPFTYAFREIKGTEADGVTFLDASMDGIPMPQGAEAGQVEVVSGDPLKVTWHFAETSDAAHVFVVRYRVDGLIRIGGADTLIWRAIPDEHGYPIASSTIRINYPANVRLLEAPTLDRDFNSAQTDHGVSLTTSGVADDEEVILTAKFPSGSLAQTAPAWQLRQEQENATAVRTLPFGFLGGLATLVLGGVGLFFYIRVNSRELNLPAQTHLAAPPAEVPSAVIGKLLGQAHSFMGGLFDLAQRGLLEVREEHGAWGSNHILERKEASISLVPHEQGLLDAIFKPGEVQVSLSEIATRLAYKTSLFDQPLEQELVQRGWLDPERKQKRMNLVVVGLLGLLAAMGIFIAAAITTAAVLMDNLTLALFTAALAGVGVGAFLLSILLLVYSAIYSPLTPTGEEQKIRWQGFANYLKLVSQGKEPAVRADTFERYLPYAAVFGLGADWTKVFQKLGGVPLPVWFHALAGSNGDFGAMVAVMSASDGAGYSASADGGGGASGGGSSGAG
jgi:hypothetical protein